MLLNFAGGIVGGIWLAILGQWSLVGGGLAVGIASTFILSLALMPGFLFLVPATAALERKRFLFGTLLGAISFAWTLSIISLWGVASFLLVLPEERGIGLLPYLLWAYSIATGPWTYMASRESQADPNSSSSITAFFACLGAAATMLGVLITGERRVDFLAECFCTPIILCFLFQLTAFISAVRTQALEKKYENASDDLQPNSDQPKTSETSPATIRREARPSNNGWYISVNEKQVGPAQFNDLLRLVEKGLLAPDIHVWCPDEGRWMRAGDVPGLFSVGSWQIERSSGVPPPSVSAKDRILRADRDDPIPAARSRSQRFKNYFARHWRGELSLSVSYWVNCVLANFAAAVAIGAIAATPDLKREFDPDLALFSIVSIWVCLSVVAVWQIVGAWRAATHYRSSHPTKYWGGIAKVFLVIAAFQGVGGLISTGLPEIKEYYNIYAGDQEVGSYAFRVLRDGRELEFTGGITFGAAKAFQQFVDAMGGLQLVHLDSPGGRISEAVRIGDVIKSRSLSTYVSHQCMSACTIIFLNGKDRLITSEGKLGFHQPDFPGMSTEDRQEAIASQENLLEQLGVSASFAHKASSAAPNDIWVPTLPELLSQHIATNVVDPSDYAISGLGQKRLTDDQIENMLLGFDVYAAIKRSDPKSYALILQKVTEGFQQGETMSDVATVVLPIVDDVFSNVLPFTSDSALVAYMKFKTSELATLNLSDPAECYFIINPDQANASILRNIQNKYAALNDQDNKLKAEVINNYSREVVIPADSEIRSSMNLVAARLGKRHDFDQDLFSENIVSPEKYEPYCSSFVAFYEEVLQLPQNDGVKLLRHLLASK
jgi:hypothetical protein